MVRKVQTVSCGQAGLQLGDILWRDYCAEHGVLTDGTNRDTSDYGLCRCFFEEANGGLSIPSNSSAHLEANLIDDIGNGCLANLLYPEFLLNGKEDATNNFTRGHYTVGKEIIDQVNERKRKLVEKSDSVGALILSRMGVNYGQKSKLDFNIYLSPIATIRNSVVESYNVLSSKDWLSNHSEVLLMLDVEAIYGSCQNSVIELNGTSLGFKSEMRGNLNPFEHNVVSFPRLHFMTTSMASVLTPQKLVECFRPSNFLVKLNDFDVEKDKFMEISLNYRDNVKFKEANTTVQWLKHNYYINKKCTFVEWRPSGYNLMLNETAAVLVQDNEMGATFKRNVTMIGNKTGSISRVFIDRVGEKYDSMYSECSFLHWYFGASEFLEARKDLEVLEKDYLDLLTKQTTDEKDGDDDDEIGGFIKYKQHDVGVAKYINGNNDDRYKFEEIAERFFTAMDDQDYVHDGNIDNRSTQTDDDAESERFEFDGWLIKQKNNNISNEIINMTMSMEEDEKLEKIIDGVAWSDPSCNSNTSNSNSNTSSSTSSSSGASSNSSSSGSSGSSSMSTASSSSSNSSGSSSTGDDEAEENEIDANENENENDDKNKDCSTSNNSSACDNVNNNINNIDTMTNETVDQDCQIVQYEDKSRPSIELAAPIENKNENKKDTADNDDDDDDIDDC